MRITVLNLNLDFNEDLEEMREQVEQLRRLEAAIENSAHYKLLSGKTQMLGKDRGISKKERSRMIHTKDICNSVVQRTIIKIYDRVAEYHPDLKSEEYRNIYEYNKQIALLRGRIMAKAHDIGHVACGHEGEKAIAQFVENLCKTNGKQEEIDAWLEEHERYFGEEYERDQGHDYQSTSFSFEHNELSAILLNQIIERENINLSEEERKKLTLGILGHSTSRTPIQLLDDDIVAQIVRVADKVEYINADWDEISSLINIDSNIEADILSYLQMSKGERVAKTVEDLTEEAFRIGSISEKHTTMRRLSRMRNIYKDIIYMYDGEYSNRVINRLINISDNPNALERYYLSNPVVSELYPREFTETTLKDVKKLRILDELLEISDNPTELDIFYAERPKVARLCPKEFVETVLKDTKASLSENKRIQIEEARSDRDTYGLVSIVVEEIGRQFRTGRNEEYKEFAPIVRYINSKYKDTYNRIFDEKVYFKSVMQGENSERIHFIYNRLLQYYYRHPEEIPSKVDGKVNPIDPTQSKEFSHELNPNYTKLQRVLEYISLFDDKSLMERYKKLVQERIDKGPGYGVEPVTIEEIKRYLKRKNGETGIIEGELMEAAKSAAQQNDYSTHNDEEILRRYIEECDEFYRTKLTPEGKRAKREYYRNRWKELEEDSESWKIIRQKEGRTAKQPLDKTRGKIPLKSQIINRGDKQQHKGIVRIAGKRSKRSRPMFKEYGED